MTLSNAPAKEIKNGNGVTTVFSFTFVINAAPDLKVYLNGSTTPLVEGTGTTNYSISVADYPGNGSITYPATLGTELATGDTLTLARMVDLDQETDLQNQSQYKPETVEATFDYGRMVDLQQQDQIDRSIKAPISDNSGANYEFPIPVANTVIGIWNAAANAILEGPTASQISGAEASAIAAAASAVAAAASASLTREEETGSSYTLVLTDVNKFKDFTNASALTVTIPPNSSVAFPIGSQLACRQGAAANQLTFAPGAGVFLLSKYGRLKTENVQYAMVHLIKTGTDSWQLTGDMSL